MFLHMQLKAKMDGIIIKYNEDGEPNGSAGAPILNVLLKQNLSNVLAIVTRYFGGTLLGTGGLVNSYTSVVTKALEKTEYIEKKKGYEVELIINYDNIEKLKKYLNKKEINILNIEYKDDIKINIEIVENIFENLKKDNLKQIKEKILNIKILKEKYV